MDLWNKFASGVGGAWNSSTGKVGGAWDAATDYKRDNDRVSIRWNTYLWMVVTLVIIALTWFALGAAAWITAVMCFQRSGNFMDHLLGFFIAILTGPMFWLFYFVKSGYCR